ncbi:hypothetical protein BV25DRAFT_1824857 [Artomyces pyxidatus]|uniref:Uncharacterized protein n=1 Tax=Artomyces pyxidatus TaxID=48021 RepID=A0ACB8T3F9_9AGAM|nr:hypothetical protein BV25DRAFT_1824857 [Artomyces pyxidatus]
MTSGMMRARILQGPGLVSGIQSVDPLMRDVIEKCLERNPAKRLDIAAIKALEYFADVDWDIVEKDLGADIVIPAPLPTQSSADSTSPSFPTILIPPPLFISQTLEQLSSPWNPDLSVSLILEQEFPGNDTQSILSTGTSSLSSDHTNTSRVVLAQAHRTQIVEARPVSVSLEPPAPVADYAPSDPPSPIVRPPNPSPSSSKSTHALDTESGDARASFLPCLSDGEEGTVRVGLGVSVTEFGRLVATDDEDPVPGNLAGVGAGMTVAEREMCMRVQEADAASGAEELSIMAALALPIPVLVGEVPGGVGRASSKKLRKRRKEEHVSASDELQVDVPEISWNGFDGMDDPFRRDSGLAEDDAEGRTVDRTFRWSALPPPATPAHQSTLSQRLRRRSRLLLRKSRSSFFAASPVLDAEEADVPPTPPLPCELGVGVKRIGRGIGYTRAVAASAVVEDLAGVHVGCYPGMGLRRRGAGTEAEAEAGPARIEDSVSSRSVLEIGHGPAVAAMGSI